jgi:hypothetical protein
MKTHNLEAELIEPVKLWLRAQGCTTVVSELRFFDRGIDIYGIRSSRPRTTFAIELKLTDWQRALQQAAVYQLCCDLSYIAMPIGPALSLDLAPFKQCGVGILMVRRDGTVGTLLESRKSTEVRRDYVSALSRMAMEEPVYAT